MHSRKMLLFFGNETCEKRSTENCFDVTMRSFNGAEIRELAGLSVKPKKYTSSNQLWIIPR